jgi:hypothetical protein
VQEKIHYNKLAATRNAVLTIELNKTFEQDLKSRRTYLFKPLPIAIITTPVSFWAYKSMCNANACLALCFAADAFHLQHRRELQSTIHMLVQIAMSIADNARIVCQQ